MLFLVFTLPLGTEFASHSTKKMNAIQYSPLPFLASSPNTKSKFLTCFPGAGMMGMRKRKQARAPIWGWRECLREGAKVKWASLSGVDELRALGKLPGKKKQWVDHSPAKQQRTKGVASVYGCRVAAIHWVTGKKPKVPRKHYGLTEWTCPCADGKGSRNLQDLGLSLHLH